MHECTPHSAPLQEPRRVAARLRAGASTGRIWLAKLLLGPLFRLTYRLAGNKLLQGVFLFAPSQWLIYMTRLIGWKVPEETIFSGHLQLAHLGEAGLNHLKIGPSCYFGPDVLLDLSDAISLGQHVALSPRVTILTHADPGPGGYLERHFYPGMTAPVQIDDHVWIGAGAIVLPGVRVGSRSVVAAGAVVTRDVAPDCVVAGVPARVVKHLSPPSAGTPAPKE